MDLKEIRYFKTVAECGSFSKAASHLRIAQPALSRKIQKLEHGLGVKLLRRGARGVSPTEAGQALLQRAITFEQGLDEMRREMARYAERATGTLRVAVQSPLSLVLAPELLRAYGTAYPGVTLELTEGFSGDLMDAMLTDRIDLVVGDTPSHPHADFTLARLWSETLQAVGPIGGIIGERPEGLPLPLQEFAALPIIMPCQRHGIRRLLDSALERQKLRFRPAVEANGALMIIQLVKAGFGYTLLPSNSIRPWVATGDLEAVDVRPAIRRTVSVMTRTALLDDPRVLAMRDLVLRLAPDVVRRKRSGEAAPYLGGASEIGFRLPSSAAPEPSIQP